MYQMDDRCNKCNCEVESTEVNGEVIYHCPDCNPACPICGTPQDAYHGVQDPFWVCPNCNGSDGLEVAWCESCGTPYICGDDPRCSCEDDEEDEEEDN